MAVKNTTLEDLSAVIGFGATLRLAAWYGDGVSNLYIPAEVNEAGTLVKLVGLTAARRLSDEWGNQFLAVPYIDAYEIDLRRRATARMLERGFGTREIAAALRISERRVQQMCRELEAEGLIPVIGPVKTLRRNNRDDRSPTLENWMANTAEKSEG
jgi:hypothetical protein